MKIEDLPDVDSSSLTDQPIQCTAAPVYQGVGPRWVIWGLKIGSRKIGPRRAAPDERCPNVATWDEFYRCEEGAMETGHRCDTHHAESIDPNQTTWCAWHGARHPTTLVASYPRSRA